jgi:hypothetical protein
MATLVTHSAIIAKIVAEKYESVFRSGNRVLPHLYHLSRLLLPCHVVLALRTRQMIDTLSYVDNDQRDNLGVRVFTSVESSSW